MSLSSFSRSSSGCASKFCSYNELIERDLQRGDLIEIDRGAYNHWAFYAGQCENGTHWCFHVTSTKKKDILKSIINGSEAAAIKKHKLKEILEDTDSKKPSLARVNNKINEAKRKNCVPLPTDEVIDDLEKRMEEPIEYNLKDWNCEHNVTTWKYGAGWSRQVENVEFVKDAITLAGYVSGVVGVALLRSLLEPSGSKRKVEKN